MQSDIEGQQQDGTRVSPVVEGEYTGDELGHEPDLSPFSLEDDSFIQLYESRLRRLQAYESTVSSPYDIRSSPIDSTSPLRPGNSDRRRCKQVIESESFPPRVASMITPREPPSYIEIGDANEEFDALDELTLSTDVDSQLDSAVTGKANLGPALEFPKEVEDDNIAEIDEVGISSNRDGPLSGTPFTSEEFQEIMKGSTTDEEVDTKAYSNSASQDSKYATYALLVDPENDDRAVEIILYSAARPHMRGFHFAWMTFFVAFFTWFSITPLLSEVAVSLNLNREEIWNSSVLGVAGSAVTRVLIGPINDIYGPRWTISATLLFIAIPTGIAGIAIQSATSLYVIRLLVGVAGSAFVTCQFWSSSLFIPEVAGTANSLTAGWGNLGGGLAQIVMGSLIFPLLKVMYGGDGYGNASRGYISDKDAATTYDRPSDLAWRTAMAVPACMCVYMAYACLRYSDDSPKGNFRERKDDGLMQVETAQGALFRSCCKLNTWLLVLQYGCCFGVEITMMNAAALYFQEEYGQTTESAAAIASVFGWMNLFARGIGGFCSDMTSATQGMRGRLRCQFVLLLVQGGLVCLFSTTSTLATSIVVMVIFSIFVQASEGSTFAIVPYVDYGVTGSVAGVVGAGGNVGGVVFSLLFRELSDRAALLLMGFLVMASSFLTVLIAIPGHRTLLGGEDSIEVLERRDTHVDQFGTIPNVEIHVPANDTTASRQTILRPSGPSTMSIIETIQAESLDPSAPPDGDNF